MSQNIGVCGPFFITHPLLFVSTNHIFQGVIIVLSSGIKVANSSLDYCSLETVAVEELPEAGLQQP
jgi:hypothetical protein